MTGAVINMGDIPMTLREGRCSGLGARHRVLPPGAVRIDRGGPWGNPYVIGKPLNVRAPEGGAIHVSTANRGQVITAFEWYAEARLCMEPEWLEPLRGKVLACWCAPEPCHGDVIVRLLAEIPANASPVNLLALGKAWREAEAITASRGGELIGLERIRLPAYREPIWRAMGALGDGLVSGESSMGGSPTSALRALKARLGG